jgi:hypothetical protein
LAAFRLKPQWSFLLICKISNCFLSLAKT